VFADDCVPPDCREIARRSGSHADDRLTELVELSRAIGRQERDLVVLAEGNTSVRLQDGSFFVKASGARLESADPASFVRVRLEPLLEAVLGDAPRDVRELLRSARVASSAAAAQPSIETFLHAVAIGRGGAQWVIHTHPTELTGLLCSSAAEELLLSGAVFPDEAVVCGARPLYVRYAEPGLELARALARQLDDHIEGFGAPPRVILLANHGLVALGASAAEAESVTVMAVKAARVRVHALAAGGVRPLAPASVEAIIARQDEVERRALLVAGDSRLTPSDVPERQVGATVVSDSVEW
jgi:rhamnose utilization protein RhaD (predicted bifunctional aldolase and dehydrogenase)